MRFLNFLMGSMLLFDEAGQGGGGAGGGGGGKDGKETVTLTKEQFDDIMARLPAKDKPKEDDPSLADKAKKERDDAEAAKKKEKSLESAIMFNNSAKDFLKNNDGLIPKTIESIFATADKQTFDSQEQKANEMKVGIISEYFAVQSNMDLLTGPQKIEVDNFLKLTKNGKQERVETVYAMIFEPTLEMARKIEKAKQLNNGDKNQTEGEKALVERMMKGSRKHYLGEK